MLFNDTYKTIEEKAEGEFKDRGSKFLSFAFPVKSENDCKNIIKEIKLAHPQANHHCWAVVLGFGKEFQKCADDREPNNTAGKPILRAILQHDLTNVLVVVVRYFGGKLLGVPGLINAYNGAAIIALEGAKFIEKHPFELYEINPEFEVQNQMFVIAKNNQIKITHSDDLTLNKFTFEVKKSEADKVIRLLKEAGITSIKYIQTI
jgi:uncharacterized YigZ family protein